MASTTPNTTAPASLHSPDEKHEASFSQQPLAKMDSEQDIELKGSAAATSPPKDARFWMIMLSLAIVIMLSALDITAVSTALPTIAADLKTSEFAWIGSAYVLTSTAFQPFTGSLANIFGRRAITLGAIAFFAVGSALCGAAQNIEMMIAGRATQGTGGGAILAMIEIIVADLVPLSERGLYQGIFGAVFALASAIGPPIGGALAESNWRWLFYLNLPLCGISALFVVLFVNLRTPGGTMREKFARIDFVGNAIAIASSTAVVIALTWAGVRYSWDSWRILVPLILGGAGLVAFVVYEAKVPREPTLPFDILKSRTAILGYAQVFLHGITSMAVVYYLPVYLQGVQGESPIKAGVSVFNLSFTIAPFAMVAGAVITVTKNYWYASQVGWALCILGFGLMSMISAKSSRAFYEGIPIFVGIGLGVLYTSPVFPILAPTKPSRNAEALAFLSFLRSFGQVWGVTIGATILQNELSNKLPAEFTQALGGHGGELAYAAIAVIGTLEQTLRDAVRVAFADSISIIWIVLTPISGLGLLASLSMKSLPLTMELDDKWGIDRDQEEKEKRDSMATVV